MAKTFLVRHAECYGGALEPKGQEQANSARDELLRRGLGGGALILSSSAVRAMKTAEVIAIGLGVNVYPSKRIEEGGNTPDGVRSLDEWIDRAMGEVGIPISDKKLIVVTHAPLIAVAKVGSRDNCSNDVRKGEVFEYPPGTWNNSAFREIWENVVEEKISGKYD